jgi:tetratricopeptide (TPR) repeat protein
MTFSTITTNVIDAFSNLYQVTSLKFEEYPYVRFGRFLKSHLQNPQKTTLIFGDAGCVPLTSNVRFIDSNGLTEPYIAHLFKMQDKQRMSKIYTDYILGFNPDMIVIGVGAFGADNNGNSPLFLNPHSPFGNSPQLSEYETYRRVGFMYFCSIKMVLPYDLHLAVRPNSPQFVSVVYTLYEYCSQNGYFLENGILKIWDGKTVHFPRYELENNWENILRDYEKQAQFTEALNFIEQLIKVVLPSLKPDVIERIYLKKIELIKYIPNYSKQFIASDYMTLGRFYTSTEKWDKAVNSYQEAINLYTSLVDNSGLLSAYSALAATYGMSSSSAGSDSNFENEEGELLTTTGAALEENMHREINTRLQIVALCKEATTFCNVERLKNEYQNLLLLYQLLGDEQQIQKIENDVNLINNR